MSAELLRGSGKYLVGWLLLMPAFVFVLFSPTIVPDYLRVTAFTTAAIVTWMTVEIAWLYTMAFWPHLTTEQRPRHYHPWMIWAMGSSYVALLVPACYIVYANFDKPIQPFALPFVVLSLIGSLIWESALLRRHRAQAMALRKA